MARIRMIKPEFFDDPDVADVSLAARLCFIGLWTQADKAGRLEDDPRRLKVRLFPYDAVDVSALLDELTAKGMIARYTSDGRAYLSIPKFVKHQRPHPKEPESLIPAPPTRAVKKHGKTRKETANPSESGVLSLDSGVLIPDASVMHPSSADADYETFRQAYPASRRVGGKAGRRAFEQSAIGRHGDSLATVLLALEAQKRSEQWQNPRLIPLMTTWLNQERWLQELPEPSAFGTSAKTAGNITSLQRFAAKGCV